VDVRLPFFNPLRREAPRLLLIVPWIVVGGADKFNLDLVEHMSAHGWEVTVATTLPSDNHWAHLMYHHTADVFFAPHLVPRATDMARLFLYLMHTRRPNLVMVTNNEHAYHVCMCVCVCFFFLLLGW
jgi:hypothetical protein